MKDSDCELVALYGFSAECPKNTRVELDPKSTRKKGNLVFHLEEGFKVFLSWGSLGEAKKHYATAAEQASGSLQRSIKSARGKLDGAAETRNLKFRDHDAVYTHARMLMEQGGLPFFTRRVTQDAYALHVHCHDSERYYVVYAFARPEVSDELARAFEPIMSSLKCHSS